MQAGRAITSDFFSHENSIFPPALTKNGLMYHGTKHEILDCITPDGQNVQGCQTSANWLISADFEFFLMVLGISANQLKHRTTFLGGGVLDLRNFDEKNIRLISYLFVVQFQNC